MQADRHPLVCSPHPTAQPPLTPNPTMPSISLRPSLADHHHHGSHSPMQQANFHLQFHTTVPDSPHLAQGLPSNSLHAASPPSIGYPESSQRTLLEERSSNYVVGYGYPHRNMRSTSLQSFDGNAGATPDLDDGHYAFFHAPAVAGDGVSAHSTTQPVYTHSLSPLHAQSLSSSELSSSDFFPCSPPCESADTEASDKMAHMITQFEIQNYRDAEVSSQKPVDNRTLTPSIMPPRLCGSHMKAIDNDANVHYTFDASAPSDADDLTEEGSVLPESREDREYWSQSSLAGAFSEASLDDKTPDDDSIPPSSRSESEQSVSHAYSSKHYNTYSAESLALAHTSGHRPLKKSKMHSCKICQKAFPRPSGLQTHMNSHSGMKPYKCTISDCGKSFAVRSNAKRHLKTHGLNPASMDSSHSNTSKYLIGFDTPVVNEVHESGRPRRYKWVPQSLSTRTNVPDWINSPSSVESEDSDDILRSVCPILPTPLPAVVPSRAGQDWNDNYEERDSYLEAAAYPYHPSQWRGLVGPAAVPFHNA